MSYNFDIDLERGSPSSPVIATAAVQHETTVGHLQVTLTSGHHIEPQMDMALHECLVELGAFLSKHTDKVLASKQQNQSVPACVSELPDIVERGSVNRPTHVPILSGNTLGPVNPQDPAGRNDSTNLTSMTQSASCPSLPLSAHATADHNTIPSKDTHMDDPERFLPLHVDNVRLQGDSLLRNTTGAGASHALAEQRLATSSIRISTELPKKCKAMSQAFSVVVVISTFTAGIIVAFISLMISLSGGNLQEDLQSNRSNLNGGILLGLLALALNLAIAVIAGSNAARISYASSRRSLPVDLDFFAMRLILCIVLQLLAALLFDGSIVFFVLSYDFTTAIIVGCTISLGIAFTVYDLFNR